MSRRRSHRSPQQTRDGAIQVGPNSGTIQQTNIFAGKNALGDLLSMKPVPTDYVGLFDRRRQDAQLREMAKQSFKAGHRVMAVVLPGPGDENHPLLVQRYAFYTLRDVCRINGQAHVPKELRVPLALTWPSAHQLNQENRFRELLRQLGEDVVGESLVTDSDEVETDGVQQALARWFNRKDKTNKHQIIYYQLMSGSLSRGDAELLKRWIDFWRSLELNLQSHSLTVFFCLDTPRFPLPWCPARRCLRLIQECYAGVPNVVALEHLASPDKDEDIRHWLDECKRTWKLEWGEQVDYCLNEATLRASAEKAFGFLRKKRSLAKLEEPLQEAVRKAHEKYWQDHGRMTHGDNA